MEDTQIIALFEQRHPEAIAEAKRKFDPLCRGLAGRILRCEEDVEECLSDTYLALWNAIPPEKPAPLSAYIARICRNLAMKRLEHLSAEKRGMEVTISFEELDGCIPHGSTPERMLEEKELSRAILVALEKESKQNRIIFLRRYYFFDSVKEIAARLGCSEELVKSSLHRTRKKLKAHLIKEEWIYER